MKCPKCAYLGFETGDRCKNCGYDFSLLASMAIDRGDELRPGSVTDEDQRLSLEPDYEFRAGADDETSIQVNADLDAAPLAPEVVDPPLRIGLESQATRHGVAREPWPAEPASPRSTEMPQWAGRLAAEPAHDALPLFAPPDDDDDEPLIKMPPAPRPPLAVRRPLESPRLRAVPRGPSSPSPAPALQFPEDLPSAAAAAAVPAAAEVAPRSSTPERAVIAGGLRLLAALVDHAILLGIDLGVVYFTVRLAGLSMGEWRLLPLAPMLAFLGLLKVAYFYAFTAVGGQTIGKMAVGTCVITEDGGAVDAGRAMRRTFAAVLSVLPLGLGFIPALFGHRLALHDRIAHTRVVRLRSV